MTFFQPTSNPAADDLAAPKLDTSGLATNQGTYYGLTIPVSGGKRALVGVPIFAGAVRIEDDGRRYVDLAYSFGEPIAPPGELLSTTITKLWVNGELVEQLNAASGWNTSSVLDYTLYPGYPDQLPDPTIRKWLGEDSTPGFRGLTYVVFRDFPLHLFSSEGAVPLVRAELVDIVTNSVQVQEFTRPETDEIYNEVVLPNWERMHLYTFAGSGSTWDVMVTDLTTNVQLSRNPIVYTDGTEPGTLFLLEVSTYLDPDTSYIVMQHGGGNSKLVITVDPYSGFIVSEFGSSNASFTDSETNAQTHDLRAAVSRSQGMNDRLFAASGFVTHLVSIWRLDSAGQVSLAWSDNALELLGDEDTHGDIQDLTTGDPIGALSGTNRGFGTFLISRGTGGSTVDTSSIYRVTVSEGLNGDGVPDDDVTADEPLRRGFSVEAEILSHLVAFGYNFESHVIVVNTLPGSVANFFGPRRGVNSEFFREYVDINAIETSTDPSFTPTSNPLPNDQPVYSDSVDIDLDDVGDLSSSVLNDRVVFSLDYGSQREMSILSGRIDGPTILEGAVWVHSNNGSSWTEVTATANPSVGGEVAYGDVTSGTIAVPVDPLLPLETLRQDVFDSGNPITARYIGIALPQDDFTGAGTLTFLDKPTSFGKSGRVVGANGDVLYPDLKEPYMVRLWDAPDNLEIQLVWRDKITDDLIVQMNDLSDPTEVKWLARLHMKEDVRGIPSPADPLGAGVDAVWMRRLDEDSNEAFLTSAAFTHGAIRHSNIDNGTLGIANETSEKFNLVTLATGHQRLSDFNNWRYFGNTSDEPNDIGFATQQVWYGPGGFLLINQEIVGGPDDQWVKTLPFLAGVSGYPLSTFLTWFALRVGYTLDDIEITGITDQVIGSIILRRVPFRNLVDTIGIVYGFRVYESEGKIKFRKTGKGASFSVDWTLTTEDLSAIQGGEGLGTPDPVAEVQRSPTLDSPGVVELVYLNPEIDYQVAEATARRTRFPVSTSVDTEADPARYAVPFVMSSEEAALRASRMLFTIWSAQARTEFRLPTKFLEAEPADVVSIPVDGVTYTVQNTTATVNADHSVSVEAEAISSEEIESVGSQDPLQLPQSVAGPSASELFFLDIPPLRGEDIPSVTGTSLSVYSAVVSRGQGSWQAGRLLVRAGTPVVNTLYENSTNSDASGMALNIIGPWAEHSLDDENTLRVLLRNDADTFASITDQELLDGGNLAAYGAPGRWEIVQVQTVTNVAGTVYDLTNLVRGLYGTALFSEQHELGDQFILLDRPPVRLHVVADQSQLGRLGEFKAVGLKQDLNTTRTHTLVLTGAFERMLPVTNVAAVDSGSDIVISWDRRTRLGTDTVLEDSTETVPSESTAGNYEIEIFTTPNLPFPVRTVTDIGEPTYTYASVDILSDFGTKPGILFLKVYHLSTEVGRSLPAIANIDVE